MRPGEVVFLSASVPYRPEWTEGATPPEIEEAIVCLARAVFARKGRILFGGHPSISPLVSSVASEYFPPDSERVVRPVITFQSEFFRGRLPDETWDLHRMGWSTIRWTPDVARNKDRSLELMREWMLGGPEAPLGLLEEHHMSPPLLMVAIGGMEGVRDEAVKFLAYSPSTRVHAVESGGGAASLLLKPRERWGREMITDAQWEVLAQARDNRRLVGLEEEWWRENRSRVTGEVQLQPYAAMTQWLLDRADG